MKRKLDDLDSCLKTKIKNMKEELEHKGKVVDEFEIEDMMLELESHRHALDDPSQTSENADLKSYLSERIIDLRRELDRRHDPYTSVTNEPILGDDHDIPKASDVAPEGRGNMKPSDGDDDEKKKTCEGGESSKSGAVDDDDDA
ncbi:unnamed protein product [Eruca vesicaria subsp. sativa]|uniref:Uncharacterized protein n=1 Tax=Eruca vesicaria subsp. sativa TaxID=29727 RepID=A0ABC8LF22_ERUVS|nr:unnamed protein product [Eruca vesicaria subsp. sativa]